MCDLVYDPMDCVACQASLSWHSPGKNIGVLKVQRVNNSRVNPPPLGWEKQRKRGKRLGLLEPGSMEEMPHPTPFLPGLGLRPEAGGATGCYCWSESLLSLCCEA